MSYFSLVILIFLTNFSQCFSLTNLDKKNNYFLNSSNPMSNKVNNYPTTYKNSSLKINKNEIAGNVKSHYQVNEYGKVSFENANNVIPAFYIGNENFNFIFSTAYTFLVPYQEGLLLTISNGEKGKNAYIYNPPKSGFNATIEKYLHYDDWMASVEYCWFYNYNQPKNNDLNPVSDNISPWINISSQDVLDLSSFFNNQFNIIYVSLYRNNQITNSLLLTSKIGLLGAWENQHLLALFEVAENSGLTVSNYQINYKQDWWCTAPFAGIKVSYLFISNMKLFLYSSTSMNLAKHSITQKQEKTPITPAGDSSVAQNFINYYWDVEPMVNIELGISTFYSFEKVTISGKISWQSQTWFNHNGFQSLSYQPLKGNYSMQGLIVNFGVAF